MHVVSISILFFCKLFFQVDILLALFSAFMALKNYQNKEIFFIYYLFIVISNSFYFLLIFNMLLFLIFLYEKKYILKLEQAYFLLLILGLGLITFFNISSLYDILRLLIIASSFIIFFVNIQYLNIKSIDRKLFIIYVLLIIAQIVNIFFLGLTDRGSIFVGTENTAVVIFLIFTLYLLYSQVLNVYYKYLTLFLYLVFLSTTESRTVIMVILLMLYTYIISMIKKHKSSIIIISAFIITFSLISFNSINLENNRTFNFISQVLSLYNDTDINELEIENLYSIDIRGRLLSEGIGKVTEKPLLGHGVIYPDTLKELKSDESGMSSFHNIILDVLVTYGVLGFVMIFIWFIFLSLHLQNNNFKHNLHIVLIWIFLLLSILQPYFFNSQIITLFYLFLFLNYKGTLINETRN